MDSAYTITVGFPGQIYPEQRYLINIDHKGLGLSPYAARTIAGD